MSSISQPTSYVDLYTDLLNRMRADTTTTSIITLAQRYINAALHDFHIQQNWPWAERRTRITTAPTYTTGTIAVADGARTTITGTSTLWNTAITGLGRNNVIAGGKIRPGGSDNTYTVSVVNSDTSITTVETVVDNLGTGIAAGTNYTYYEDEYALASDFFRLVDARQFSQVMNLPVVSSGEFYRRYPRNDTPGAPRKATIIQLAPSGSTDWQPRVMFNPAPDRAYSIPYRYITRNLAVSSTGVGQVSLVADTDEPIIPVRYRHALIEYGAYVWYRDRKDDQRATEAYTAYTDLFKRIAGDFGPEHDNPRLVPVRMRQQPFLATRRGPGRFTTGTAWDELREGISLEVFADVPSDAGNTPSSARYHRHDKSGCHGTSAGSIL